jgi:hypothetical protein
MRRTFALLLVCALATTARAEDALHPVSGDDARPSTSTGGLLLRENDAGDQPDLAFASVSDPNPGTGRGQIIAGWVATGVGLAGIAQASTCRFNGFDQEAALKRCRNLGIGVGALGLAIGVPWLVFGYRKRAALRAWKQRHGLSALPEPQLAGNSLLLDWRF